MFRRFGRALILASSLAFLFGVVAAASQGGKEPDTVVLKGAPMGGVKLAHKAHAHDLKVKCETCHHPSRPEKALKSPQQACSDCHTKTVAAPMKTNARAAFHDAPGKKGICIDCHATEAPKGKKAPVKCLDCHKKENG